MVEARAIDDREQVAHARDLLRCSSRNQPRKCSDVLAVLARELHERRDLLGHRPLLLERERHRGAIVAEGDLRAGDGRDDDLAVGVDQVLDERHRVVSLLDRLAVEVRREARKRLGVVVHRDGVSAGRPRTRSRPLVERVGEPAHPVAPAAEGRPIAGRRYNTPHGARPGAPAPT
jgi:hypothetical protein